MIQITQRVTTCIIIILYFIGVAKAQAPQAIPYQAAARNSAGTILPNKTIGLRFTVHDATATGTLVYKETQNATTNAIGMFIVNIGQGTAVTGTFSAINWGSGNKFMQVEFDSTATGSHYLDLGTQQLMSVPYALNAGNGVPVGTIEAFGGDTSKLPNGWLLCDGSVVSRTKYVALFAVIDSVWGTGGSTTTFRLPDARGMFLRGVTGAASNVDPDASGRWSGFNESRSGNTVGSYQSDMYVIHNHATHGSGAISGGWYLSRSNTRYSGGGGDGFGGNWGSPDYSLRTSTEGGSETRPKNIYVHYIIKY